jgi:hypothetical protein
LIGSGWDSPSWQIWELWLLARLAAGMQAGTLARNLSGDLPHICSLEEMLNIFVEINK